MTITPQSVCLWLALIVFVVAAVVPTPPTRVALTPAGLAFLVAGLLFGQT